MSKYTLLDEIESPLDLRGFTLEELGLLCGELRQFLIEKVSETGGHLASNLGVVELTVALHTVFETPVDKIVWDVGHQSYTHKILTGRRDRFDTLRQGGGLSGFPKTKDSEHDAFLAGHSSTSLSVAAGLARAKRVRGEKGSVVAVIGDGAFTGGMSFEGLNNAAQEGGNLIVILNDNKMSIGKNVGSLSAYLTRLRTNRSYFKLKDKTKSALRSIPLVGQGMVEAVSSSKAALKNVMYSTSFFEEMGFVHMGPVNGHNLQMLTDVLERAKSLDRPVFIHMETTKGKGYEFAERNPGHYHGVQKFNPKLGSEELIPGDNFSEVFGKYLTGLAMRDENICAVTAAMKYATGLHYFSRQLKGSGRFVDVGIAEQHAVTFCAGLAAGGMLPVFAVYSSFLQRAYDQLLHDCSIEPRHVVLAVDRAGLVGEDGETHHGVFDCAFLSSIPRAAIYSPATYSELRYCLRRALYHEKGLVAVRYPRGAQPKLPEDYVPYKANFVHDAGESLLLVTYGRQWAEVHAAVELLRVDGINPGILKLTKIFPLDPAAVEIAQGYDQVVFVEEGMRTGGIGGHFAAALADRGYTGTVAIRAVEGFVPQGTVYSQLRGLGLDRVSIVELVRSERKKIAERVRFSR